MYTNLDKYPLINNNDRPTLIQNWGKHVEVLNKFDWI